MIKKDKSFNDKRSRDENYEEKYVEKLISMNRVSKSTKGGRAISFAALVVVGDKKGKVGFALGKANDVTEAIRKASLKARKNMKSVSLKKITSPSGETVNVTIPHEIIGNFKSAKVVLRPATPGTGVIAGGAVRAICDAVGVTDILSKSLGSNNKANVIKATLNGLDAIANADMIARLRDKSVSELWG